MVPGRFWAEAVNTSVYVRNRSLTSALDGVTPYECLVKQKPDAGNLRVFGCVVYVHIPDGERRKLDAKSRNSIFVGYPEGMKGYKLYDPSSQKFIRSRGVVFQERNFHDFGNKQSMTKLKMFLLQSIFVTLEMPMMKILREDLIMRMQMLAM